MKYPHDTFDKGKTSDPFHKQQWLPRGYKRFKYKFVTDTDLIELKNWLYNFEKQNYAISRSIFEYHRLGLRWCHTFVHFRNKEEASLYKLFFK